MSFNFNEAEADSGDRTPIPDGTIARAIFKIDVGGEGPEMAFKRSKKGELMLKTEWTILDGKYEKRKIFTHFMWEPSDAWYVKRAQRWLRSLIEGHHMIHPDDESARAQQIRNCSILSLNQKEGTIIVSLEPGDMGYADDNGIKNVLAPNHKQFIPAPNAPLLSKPQKADHQAPPTQAAVSPEYQAVPQAQSVGELDDEIPF